MVNAIARLLLYVGATIVIGNAMLRFFRVWSEGADNRVADDRRTDAGGAGRLTMMSWGAMLASSALLFAQQASEMGFATSASDVRAVLVGTAWGRGWSALTLAIIIGLVSHAVQTPRWLRAVVAVAMAVSMGGLGHAAADDQFPLLSRLFDAVHVLAAGAWIGGLLLLTRAMLSNRLKTDALLAAWKSFSTVAAIASTTVIVTGTIVAFRRLDNGSVTEIFASTYGRLLMLKVLVVAGVVSLGALHRQQLLRRSMPAERTARAELLFALAVFAVTSVLTGSAPPGE